MEQLLHYVWKHKIFSLKELKTTTGQQVEVIDTGLANTDTGPGFFNAKLKLDGVLWIGNIEIHERSSERLIPSILRPSEPLVVLPPFDAIFW